jgi:hypothetical protein
VISYLDSTFEVEPSFILNPGAPHSALILNVQDSPARRPFKARSMVSPSLVKSTTYFVPHFACF